MKLWSWLWQEDYWHATNGEKLFAFVFFSSVAVATVAGTAWLVKSIAGAW